LSNFDEIFELMQHKADATYVDLIDPEEPEERNIGMGGILKSAVGSLLSGEDLGKGVYEYIDETATNQADYDYLREKAKLIGSDYLTAVAGGPGTFLTNIDELVTGRPGEYRGQHLDRNVRVGEYSDEQRNQILNLEDAPNLLDIYLGYSSPEDEGLESIEGTNAYNVEPYVNFNGLQGDEVMVDILKSHVNNLSAGDTLKLSDYNITPKYDESIDLGKTGWTIGKDEDGQAFISLSDRWDFSGSVDETGMGYMGKLMDKIGKNPINFYGKFPLYDEHYKVMYGQY